MIKRCIENLYYYTRNKTGQQGELQKNIKIKNSNYIYSRITLATKVLLVC